jgi:hypothetical protein
MGGGEWCPTPLESKTVIYKFGRAGKTPLQPEFKNSPLVAHFGSFPAPSRQLDCLVYLLKSACFFQCAAFDVFYWQAGSGFPARLAALGRGGLPNQGWGAGTRLSLGEEHVQIWAPRTPRSRRLLVGRRGAALAEGARIGLGATRDAVFCVKKARGAESVERGCAAGLRGRAGESEGAIEAGGRGVWGGGLRFQ